MVTLTHLAKEEKEKSVLIILRLWGQPTASLQDDTHMFSLLSFSTWCLHHCQRWIYHDPNVA